MDRDDAIPVLEISRAALAQLERLREALGLASATDALEAMCAHEGLMRTASNTLGALTTLSAVPGVPILRPTHQRAPDPATVGAVGSVLVAHLPERNEIFRETMHARGLRWSGRRWERVIGAYSGPMIDRVVELACAILHAGFAVQLPSEVVRDRVERSDYEPEHMRWVTAITSGPYQGWFRLSWARDDDLYDAARRIHRSRYVKPNVLAPASSADEVEDFATMYGFRLSDGARAIIQRQRQVMDGASVADPLLREVVYPEPSRPAVPDNYGVDNDLADEPL